MLCVAQMSALCAPHRGHLLGSAVSSLGKGDPGPGMGLVLAQTWLPGNVGQKKEKEKEQGERGQSDT